MQRAAASAVAKTTNTASPGVQSPSVEESDAPSPKRQRVSTKDSSLSPAAPSASDLQAISDAIASEEQKRTEAVARQAAEAGETEWVLEFSGAGEKNTASRSVGRWGQFQILPADSLDAEDEDYLCCGRRSYGNFKRKKNSHVCSSFPAANHAPRPLLSPCFLFFFSFFFSLGPEMFDRGLHAQTLFPILRKLVRTTTLPSPTLKMTARLSSAKST
jgi:hypothetical protein